MLTTTCSCGAKYRFDDADIGRRARCKRCGTPFVVEPDETGVIPIASDPDDETGESPATGGMYTPAEVRQQAIHATSDLPVAPGSAPSVSPQAISVETVETRGYFANLFFSLFYLADPMSLATFVALWFCFAGAIYGVWYAAFIVRLGCVGFMVLGMMGIAGVGMWGWFYAQCLETINHAAAGRRALPKMHLADGVGEGMVMPLLRWYGSWVIVLAPSFLAYVIADAATGTTTLPVSLPTMIGGGVLGLPVTTQALLPAIVLKYLGIFAWPMVILCIAVGGFSTFSRFDLMIETVIKTFPMYVATAFWAFVYLLVYDLAWAFAPMPQTMNGRIFFNLLGLGVVVYVQLIAMRAIGMYYHHFKDRFAWDWG